MPSLAGGGSALQACARGDAEIGLAKITEVIEEPGPDFVGPLLAEI
jgi:hypothetical protein